MQKLIDKMQFPGMFPAKCGQDCGIPRGIVKHSFGNQTHMFIIQCKLTSSGRATFIQQDQ